MCSLFLAVYMGVYIIMQQKQEIWVKNYKPGKYRVCFLHTRDKWFVIEADSPEQARKIAKSQEKILIVKDDKTLLFGEFAKDFYNPRGEWAKYIERKGRQPYGGYYQRYQMCLNRYVLPRFSAVSMVLMTPVEIDEWLTDLCSYSTGKPLAARTKNIILTSISHIFDYAKFKGLVEKNPIDDIKLFTGSSPRPPFSRDEIARLFPESEVIHEIWPNLTWLCFYLILRDTGLRTGEALALDWANYSRQHHCFAIVQKFEQSTNRILSGTKTGVARAVVVTKRTAEFLAKLQKKQGKDSGLIFTLDGVKPYSENNVCDRLKDALERAGIPRIVNGRARTPYSFRHSFVTNALSASLNPDEVALLAGHSRQVQQGYNHPTNQHLFNRIKHLREQVEKLYT